MIRFNCDYQEGAHPRILQKLMDTNYVQTPGYGEDEFCAEAAKIIREKCAAPKADVHFLVGGTQTNLIFMSAALRSHQGCISVATGHVAVHESGAIEATGHKVITLPGRDGKLIAGEVSEYCRLHFSDEAHEHMVMPKVVYISNPTEMGTLYTRNELQALRGVCDQWNLYLYMDGARLGYGLASPENELDLPFIAEMCDAFYIGGTKQGMLFGEALVITRDALKEDFRYIVKQKGAMFAKGRLLGLQFAELLKDDLYMEMSQHAIDLAMKLKQGFAAKGYPFLMESPTNQQFPILPDEHLAVLKKKYSYSYIERVDATHSAVRFCTSWATPVENVDALLADIQAL
ncbi:MAG: low specificity L-threonine aldolase [Clostridia bacterium]|nr:low specificity L-threonine aldolase [Clostridia bacterium]